MKKTNLAIVLFSIFGLVNMAFSPNRSAGRAGASGAPGDTNCGSCHTTSAVNSGTGSVAVTSNIPLGGYTAGTVYQVNVTVSQTAIGLFGFGLTALNSSNVDAGTFSIIQNNTETQLLSSGGRTNGTHKLNGGVSSTGTKTFSLNWTAPAASVGTVTFYAAGNAANGNGANSGDRIYTTSQSVSPMVATTATIAGASSVCAGQCTSLTANVSPQGSYTYSWSNGSAGQTIQVCPPVTTTYTVSVSNATGLLTTASHTVTALPVPDPLITGNNFICDNQTTQLSVTSPTGGSFVAYNWSTGATTQNVFVTPNASTIYTVTVVNAAGCVASTSFNLTVDAPIEISINGSTALCPGATTSLVAAGGVNYVWSNGANTNTTSISAVGVYTVTVTNASGCVATSSVAVTQANNCCTFAITNMRFTVSASTRSVTFNTPVTSGCSAGSSVAYSWDFGDGTASTLANPTKTYNNSGIYTVCLTATCTSASGQVCTYQCCRVINIPDPCVASVPTFTFSASASNVYKFAGNSNTVAGAESVYTIKDLSGNVVATSDVFTGTTAHNYTYTFTTPGTYSVCRKVVRANPTASGTYCEVSFCSNIIINSTTCNNLARFTAFLTTATPLSVSFTSNSIGASSLEWLLATSLSGPYTVIGTATTFNYAFANYNTYYVKLIINKGTTCENIVIHRIEVQAPSCNVQNNSFTKFMDNNSTKELTSPNTIMNSFETKIAPSVQPNPTNGIVNILMNRLSEIESTLNVVNLQGAIVATQKVYSGTVSTEIDLSKYPSGLYLLTFLTGNGERITQKVVKE